MHSPPCIRAFMLWLTELKKLVVAMKGILQPLIEVSSLLRTTSTPDTIGALLIRQRPESEATGLCRIKNALRGPGGNHSPGAVKGGSPCRRRHLPAQRGGVPYDGNDSPLPGLRIDGQNAGAELCTLAEALEAKAGLHAHVGELFRDRKALAVISDDEPEASPSMPRETEARVAPLCLTMLLRAS